MPLQAISTERPGALGRPSSAASSECWIYTRSAGLQEVTLECSQSTVIIDGQRLRAWCVVDRESADFSFAVVYSAEMPSPEVRDAVKGLARERFKNKPWFRRDISGL